MFKIKLIFIIVMFLTNIINHDLAIFLINKQNKLVSFNINCNLLYIDIEKKNPIVTDEKIIVPTVKIFFFWKDFEFIYSISQKSSKLIEI